MTAIQIVLVCFAAFALSRVVLRFKRGGLPLYQLLLWLGFWCGVIFIVLLPGSTSAIASRLGVGRGADVVIYLALALLFYLLFRMFGKIEDVERQITRLVRAVALKDLDDRQSSEQASRPAPPPP